MLRLQFYLLSIGVFLLTPMGMNNTFQSLRFRTNIWDAEIHLQSLALNVYPAGTDIAVRASLGQTGLGPVTDFSQEGDGFSWKLPERALTVHVELQIDSLTIEFIQDASANDTQNFTWPLIEDTESIHGYIFPFFEGSYVPKDDITWRDFLCDRGPINTTAGLSMPFWGLDLGARTLTYILTNPFNNQIHFSETGTSDLGMRVSHAFTPNWERGTYGIRLSLGAASPVEPAKQYREWLIEDGEFVSFAEKIEKTPAAEKLLGAAHVYLWGDGISVKLLERFAESGLDRLWLGVDSWQDGFRHPTAVAKARELGYLIGPYDSYHSIHHPNEQDTWETAQFDLSLYETGAIVNADGTKNRGFKKKGYHLSPLAARPYVEDRVNGIVAQMPTDFNSWFIDCDAYGELFDDYSPSHPATQLDDMNARLARIAWIRDTHKMVVGSEGGAAYAAATLHFAHGMTTPVIGWGDPDMTEKTSPYYIGGYWPPEAPAIHIKQVPLKSNYLHLYYDPRFRLPLYQIVFHDSVVTTHHWLSGSLKFENAIETLALLELLYNVPPLYHLNMAEFTKHKAWIERHYTFFSPLHRHIGGKPMTDFEWLSDNKQVQRTEFGDAVELFANFGVNPFEYEGMVIPPRSVVARWIDTGKVEVFSAK